jgi:membrane protease YdiL (CAAX protease family)
MLGKLANRYTYALVLVSFLYTSYFQQNLMVAIASDVPYYFELFFSITLCLLFRKEINWRPAIDLKSKLNWAMILLLPLGSLCAIMAKKNGWTQPFTLGSPEMVWLLLLWGPILETLLYQGALWILCRKVLKSNLAAYLASCFLFSFGHFYGTFLAPVDFHSFIYFQTFYTLLLALAIGYYTFKDRDLIRPLVAHMLFNLGFYIAA